MTLVEDGSTTDPDPTITRTVRAHPEETMLLPSHIPLSVIMANSYLTYKGSRGQAKQGVTGQSLSLPVYGKFTSDISLSPKDIFRSEIVQTKTMTQPLSVTIQQDSTSLSKIRKRKLISGLVENTQTTPNTPKEFLSLDYSVESRPQVAVMSNRLSNTMLSHPMPAHVGSKENGVHGVLRDDLYGPDTHTAQPGCKQPKPVRCTKVVMRDSSNIELKCDRHKHDGSDSRQKNDVYEMHYERRQDASRDESGLNATKSGTIIASQDISHPTAKSVTHHLRTGSSDTGFYLTDKFYQDNIAKDAGERDPTDHPYSPTNHIQSSANHPNSPAMCAESRDDYLYVHSRMTENNSMESRNPGKCLETSTELNIRNIDNLISPSDTTSARSLPPPVTSSYDVISQNKLPPKKRRLYYEQDLLPGPEPGTEGDLPRCDQGLHQRSLPAKLQSHVPPQYLAMPEAFLRRLIEPMPMRVHNVDNLDFGASANQPNGRYVVRSLTSDSSFELSDHIPNVESSRRLSTETGITPNDVLDLSARIGALNTQQKFSIKKPSTKTVGPSVGSHQGERWGDRGTHLQDTKLLNGSKRLTNAVFPVSMTRSQPDTYPRQMYMNLDTAERDQNTNKETLNREISPYQHNVNAQEVREVFPSKHNNSMEGIRSRQNEPINLTKAPRPPFETSSKHIPNEDLRPKSIEAQYQGNISPGQGREKFVGRSIQNTEHSTDRQHLDSATPKIKPTKNSKAASKTKHPKRSKYTMNDERRLSPAPNDRPSPAPNDRPSPAPNDKPSPAPNDKPSPAPEEKTSPLPNGKPSFAPSSSRKGANAHVGDSQLAVEPDEDGDLPLHIAVVQNEPDVVNVLVDMMKDAGVLVDYHNQLKQTPLHLAVITKLETIVRYLLEAGASPNVPDRKGQTCCHLAVNNRTIPCFETLVKFSKVKVDLNLKNYEGLTPLHRAVQLGNTHFITSLLDHGADINLVDGKSGKTPLYLAFECNQPMVADLLLVRGADVNIPTYSGSTVLQAANTRGQHLLTNLISRDPSTNSNARDFQNKLTAKVNRTRNKYQHCTVGNLKRMPCFEYDGTGNRGQPQHHDPSLVIVPKSTSLPITTADQRPYLNNYNHLPMNVDQLLGTEPHGRLARDDRENMYSIEPMDIHETTG